MPFTNNWLDFAFDDIDSAEIMLRESKYNNVCYFSHQASEKALKGFLEHNNVNPPRVHDLITLIKLCQNINNNFANFLPHMRTLNQFYIPTRYPDAPVGAISTGLPSKELSEKALNYAREIVDFCKKELDKLS